MTDSLKVAHYFGKRHDNLLNTIKNLGCSDEFRLLNFKESYYLNEQNKKQPMFYMTQDGFTLLVMGFTGKKAMQFKEQYIKEFNEMKKRLATRANMKADQLRMNEAIIRWWKARRRKIHNLSSINKRANALFYRKICGI